MLLSNGFPYSKIRLKKFDFSPIDTPANMAKKLPPQHCSKPLFIAFFNFSHKWPTFAFAGESEHTLGSAQRIAHNGLHAETGGVRMEWYHYPRRALRALRAIGKLGVRVSKRLTCRFLRSCEHRSLCRTYFSLPQVIVHYSEPAWWGHSLTATPP